MTTPNWLNLASQGDLTAEQLASEAADLRLDGAFANLLGALTNTIELLERHGFGEQAEQLGETFLRAFKAS